MVRFPVVRIAPASKVWAWLHTGLEKSAANGSMILAISTGRLKVTGIDGFGELVNCQFTALSQNSPTDTRGYGDAAPYLRLCCTYGDNAT